MLKKSYEGLSQHPWNLSCTLIHGLPVRRGGCSRHPDAWKLQEHCNSSLFFCIHCLFFFPTSFKSRVNLHHFNEPPCKCSSSQVNWFQRSHLVKEARIRKQPLVSSLSLSQFIRKPCSTLFKLDPIQLSLLPGFRKWFSGKTSSQVGATETCSNLITQACQRANHLSGRMCTASHKLPRKQ